MVPNALSHKIGLANLLTFFTFTTGVVTLCMAAVHDLAGTIVFAICWGFSSGAVISLVPATIGLLSKDASEVGARLGIFFGVGSILGLFGGFPWSSRLNFSLMGGSYTATPIAGALLTKEYKWLNASLFAGVRPSPIHLVALV
jgi:MFS family permease